MQVSYGKLTVNDGKEMGERRLSLPRDDNDRCLAPEALGTTSHNRTLSRASTRSETVYYGGWKKFLYFMTCV